MTKKEIANLSKKALVDIIFKNIQHNYSLLRDIQNEISQMEEDEFEKSIAKSDEAFESYEKANKMYNDYLQELLEKYEIPVVDNKFKWSDLLSKCEFTETQKLSELLTKVDHWQDEYIKKI